jgi:hypothetical protein
VTLNVTVFVHRILLSSYAEVIDFRADVWSRFEIVPWIGDGSIPRTRLGFMTAFSMVFYNLFHHSWFTLLFRCECDYLVCVVWLELDLHCFYEFLKWLFISTSATLNTRKLDYVFSPWNSTVIINHVFWRSKLGVCFTIFSHSARFFPQYHIIWVLCDFDKAFD